MAETDIAVEITKILEEYNEEVAKAAEESAEEAAELVVRTLKSTSPRKARRGGKYARGWKVTRRNDGILVSYVVHNASSPGLTQLLEHGHVSRNQYGSWGRVRAIKHIAPAADAGIQRFELAVRARLR